MNAPGTSGFADRLAEFGDATALIAGDGRRISYAALAAAADAVPLPAQPTLAMLAITPTIESITLYLALLRGRHPVILVDDVDSLVGRAVRDLYRPWLPGQDWAAVPSTPLHPELAVLLSTSGSTGSPKLVRLSHRAIAANAASIATYLDIGPADRAITSLPLHYSYGLSVLHSHLSAGAATILTDASVADAEFWALFEREGATHLAGVPYSYELLDRGGFRDRALPSLRTLTQAGGRLPQHRVAQFADWAAARGVRFFVMYGQTEATARIAYLPPELAASHSDCIGVAIPGGQLHLRRADGGDAGNGPGELVYRGANVMMGYATSPADLAAPAQPPELATGDLAERTPEGLFRITGRMNRFSKLFGLRISHDEVERRLTADGLIAMVSGDDSALAVVIEGAVPPGLAATLAARHGLPASAIRVVGVASLPRLPSGKADYAAARALAAAAAAPATHRDSVAAVFAEAFPGIAISADDSFASLGGDSLNYVTFAMALEDVIGPLPADWHLIRLADLAAREGGPQPSRWLRRIESDIALRAAAISAVVMVHTGIGLGAAGEMIPGLGGGSLALMILFGFNMGRFQAGRLARGLGGTVVRDFFLRVMLPYFALLIAYGLYKRGLDPASLLLVSAWQGRSGNMLEPYWFLETAAQAVLLVAALFAVPAVRRLAQDRPLRLAWGLVAAGLATKFGFALVHDQAALLHRTLDDNLVWLGIGWLAALSPPAWQRRGLLLIALGLASLDWGVASSRTIWAVLTLATLMLVPRLPVPRPAASGIALIARASFMIYLTHMIVLNVFELRLDLASPLITLPVALLVGVLSAQAMDYLLARLRLGPRG